MLAAHCRLSGSIGFEIVAADPPGQAWDVRSAALSAEEGSTMVAHCRVILFMGLSPRRFM